MNKLNKISGQFENVLKYLNEAEIVIQSIKEISNSDGEKLNFKFNDLISTIEELQYEICMPLEMEAEEREEEIRVLERRLAELKSKR